MNVSDDDRIYSPHPRDRLKQMDGAAEGARSPAPGAAVSC
jgi:hypothetical protein